ncbi:MAG: peptide/nickel transport system substrate-binding protein [Pseudonocardiales bacterium]|jgi:ABC-type transport system substrate-binding protein|nr:peptide/nickel transport system substrate-binding protein [Pseudonocardiales bacterium]
MTGELSRRGFLIATGFTGAGLVVAGCGSGSSASPKKSPISDLAAWTDPNTGVTSATPRRGGTLTIGVESEQNGWNPPLAEWDQTGNLIAQAMYDPLVGVGTDGSSQPYLAKELIHNEDYTQWTVVARPGVAFHDGSPCDAAAIVANIQAYLASPLTGAALANVKDVRLTGPDRAMVTMRSPWVPFPAYFTNLVGWIASPAYLKSKKMSNAVGTGPFIFKEWVPNDHLTLVRNPSYWRKDMPYLDSLVFKVIPDAQARNNALLSGAVDLIQSSDALTMRTFRNRSGYTGITDSAVSASEPEIECYLINCAKKPLDDLRLRQAMAHAIDQTKINQVILGGLGTVADGPFPAGSPYHSDTGYPKYDLATARQLVQQVADEKGPVKLSITVTTAASDRQRAQLVQQMFIAAGIQTDLTVVANADLVSTVVVGKYDVAMWRNYSAPDPDMNFLWWSKTTVGPIGGVALNFSRLGDDALEAALEKGRRSPDPADRHQAYQTVAARLGGLVPQLWNNQTLWSFVGRANVQNFNFNDMPDKQRMMPMTAGKLFLTQAWLK